MPAVPALALALLLHLVILAAALVLPRLFDRAPPLRKPIIAHMVALGRPRDCMALAQYLVERGAITYAAGTWTLPEQLQVTDMPRRATESAAKHPKAGFPQKTAENIVTDAVQWAYEIKGELKRSNIWALQEQLRDYRAMGFEYVMVRHIVGDHQQMIASFDRIGKHVMPAIRDL